MYLLSRNTLVFTLLSALNISIVQSNDQCDCGLVNVQSRMSHGHDVEHHKYPWMAFIISKEGKLSKGCTGTLIDERTILTSAWCSEGSDRTYVDPSQIMIFLGATASKELDKKNVKSVEAIFPHPNATIEEYNVALIRLKNPITSSKNIRPICLPMNQGDSVFGKMKVAGFGDLSVQKKAFDLQETEVDFVDRKTCYQKLERFASAQNDTVGELSRSAICAQGQPGTGICYGDYGGPLMHENKEGRMVIAGITQLSYKECGSDEDIADIFANVALFTDFIEKHAFSPCFVPIS